MYRQRHPKRALAARLRAAGSPWAEVARLAGYADAASALRAVRTELQDREQAAWDTLQEVERLRPLVFPASSAPATAAPEGAR